MRLNRGGGMGWDGIGSCRDEGGFVSADLGLLMVWCERWRIGYV